MKNKVLFLVIMLFSVSILTGCDETTKTANSDTGTNNCTFTGELVKGAEYVNGQYTYRYMQENDWGNQWIDIETDGWGVILTDKTSTAAVTTKLCTTINDKPIVSMAFMFIDSKATSVDLSSFDTSNVVNMKGMFWSSEATNLVFTGFNTSKVTNMNSMFSFSKTKNLDLSTFDTSNVTDMANMFNNTDITNVNLSSFNTSNVTTMSGMFLHSHMQKLDLSNFDMTNVTDINDMFVGSGIETVYVKDDVMANNLATKTSAADTIQFTVK